MAGFKSKEQIEFATLMKQAGLSRAQVIAEFGLSKASVSKILSGDQQPREHTLIAFRNFARTKMETEGTPPEPTKPPGGTVYKIDAENTAATVMSDDHDHSNDVRRTQDRISIIKDKDPEAYRVIENVVTTYYTKVSKKKKKP